MDEIKELIDAVEPTRFTRVKNHIRKNKETYIVGVICLAVGILTGRQLSNKAAGELETSAIDGDVAFNNVIAGCYKPTVNLHEHHNVINEAPANRLSYITKWIDGGEEKFFTTQAEAAAAANVPAAELSKYLNGHRANVGDNVFERVGISI